MYKFKVTDVFLYWNTSTVFCYFIFHFHDSSIFSCSIYRRKVLFWKIIKCPTWYFCWFILDQASIKGIKLHSWKKTKYQNQNSIASFSYVFDNGRYFIPNWGGLCIMLQSLDSAPKNAFLKKKKISKPNFHSFILYGGSMISTVLYIWVYKSKRSLMSNQLVDCHGLELA